MTISTTTAKSRYAGDGSTTAFPTGFKFMANDHVRVLLRSADGSEAVWTEGSEYSLSGAGAPGGGTVAVSTSPTDHTPVPGEILVVKLAVPARQETSLPLGGAFPSTAVEGMADLAVLRDQQIEEALRRAVKLKETTAFADVAFPEPEPGKPVGWSVDGDRLVNLKAVGRWRGDWQSATGYVALDVVRETASKNLYVCEVAHTSGTFATDLAAGKWSEAIKVEEVEAAAAAAAASQAASEAAETVAVGAASAAATSANDAAASETNAAAYEAAAATSASAASSSALTAQAAETNAEAAASAAAASAEQVENTKLIWQGDWSAGTYQVNDAVAHAGASWIATAETAEEPGDSADEWDLLAKEGDPGSDGLGVPAGGTTGQYLRKSSNADNDTEWANAAAPVDSVFGRSGAVVAQSDDYNAGQITETAGAKIMTAAERTKLSGIATGAEANPPVPSQAQAENGASATEYSWTPQRVHQAAKDAVPWSLIVAIGNEITELSAGVAKVTFRLPHAVTLTAVRASLTIASSSGAPTFDINEGGTSILSTKLTIDQGEKTSATAATAAVISDASLADDAEITIDVDSAGTGAAGAKVTFIGYKTTT